MQATITYLLTEQAQREQMAATGRAVARKQTATVEVAAPDLQYYPVAADGSIDVDLAGAMYVAGHRVASARGTPEFSAAPDIPSLIRARRAELEADLASQIAACQKFLADAAMRASTTAGYMWIAGAGVEVCQATNEYHLACPLYAEVEAEAIRRDRIDAASEAVTRAAKKAADEVREAAKRAYIDSWIGEHADAQTRAQHEDGLLCRAAALRFIADSVLDPVGPAFSYGKTCPSRECPCSRDTDIDCIPRSLYAGWKAIQAKLPENSIFGFVKGRRCLMKPDAGMFAGDGDSAGPLEYAVEIQVPVGPFVFERLVALRKNS